MPTPRSDGFDAGELPFISVIIPHYNDLAALAVCHAHLRRQTWPGSHLEIVVADNMSTCGITAVKEAAPSATVVLAEIQGAGPARNVGFSASRGDILAFLDSDCVPADDWLAEGVSALRQWDFVGGQVAVFARNPGRPTPVESFEMVFNFNMRRYVEEVGFAGTGNMFVPRRVFTQVGGFRNGVSEDMDWSFRARAMGFRLGYADTAIVGHPARTEWTQLKRRWIRLIAETYALKREQRFGRIAFIGRALLMPLSIPPHSLRVIGSNRLHGARSRLGAIVILVRLRFWRMFEMIRAARQME